MSYYKFRSYCGAVLDSPKVSDLFSAVKIAKKLALKYRQSVYLLEDNYTIYGFVEYPLSFHNRKRLTVNDFKFHFW